MGYWQTGCLDFSLKRIPFTLHIARLLRLLRDDMHWCRPARWSLWSLALFVGLAGCTTASPPAGAEWTSQTTAVSALSAAQLFHRQLGPHWYKINEEDLRVGWGRIEKSEGYGFFPIGKRYRVDVDMRMTLLINGYAHRVANRLRMEFDAKPPFRLRLMKVQEQINDHRSSREIVRSGNVFRMRAVNSGDTVTQEISDFEYGLDDAMAIESWLCKSPAVGDFIYMAYIDPNTLERSAGPAKIISIDNDCGGHSPARHYHITHPRTGPGMTESVFNENLTLVSCRLDGGFQMELATEDEARSPIPSKDLYLHYMLPIDTAIGRSDEVQRLELSIDSRTGKLLENAPGQEVVPVQGATHYRIILDPTEGFRKPALTSEIRSALNVPEALAKDGAALLQAARKKLDGIRGHDLLVEHLMAFVDETITDSNEILSPDLNYALEKQKGDCSEHAAIFEALARAFEIPCRRVGGLVYMGDWSQSFGLHAWNEVAIDGYWQSVDVTRQSARLPPFYIRFPLDGEKYRLLTHSVARMELRVFDVEKRSSP